MKLKYIIILFSTILAFSCEKSEDINDFPLVDSKLVANCFFNPDSSFVVELSKSLSVLDNAEIPNILGATVLLYTDGVFVDTMKNEVGSGNYKTEICPQFGKKYSLEISHPDFESISASDQLPDSVAGIQVEMQMLDSSYTWDEYAHEYYGHAHVKTKITLPDPGYTDNYYKISAYIGDTIEDWNGSYYYEYSIYLEYESNSILEEGTGDYIVLSDEFFNGENYVVEFEFWDGYYYPGRPYYFKINSLSRAAYLYNKTVNLYNSRKGSPFAEPVQIYNNIENGFGIFAGYTTQVYCVKTSE
ncbi:MAG: hypothetical protein C0594_02425 [Marinilabiliales bacterium]|nr:MAG: hypothetical protein C0594_02425 [Marinilabiliales bacterium]